ncbi:MAG: chromosomal replication initiator protein DnaA [Limnochordia bacterium]
MTEQLQQIWTKIISSLQATEEDPGAKVWLMSAKPLGFRGNSLIVQVPNRFVRDWIQARFLKRLEACLEEITGRPWQIGLVLPDAFNPPKKQPDQEIRPPEVKKTRERSSSVQIPKSSTFNPKYSFDTYVVGDSNRFAHAACLAVAEEPAKAYNPLFIYGNVGLGKTHLMHAIGQYALERHNGIKVVYVSSETFTNELITAIGSRSMPEFRNKYRHVDILLIDDIQFVAGKESVQEEFFHTFNALYEANKQIVISSDRPPKEIQDIEERLRSRFEWGLGTDIQPPDYETRVAILQKKQAAENLSIPHEVLLYIAEHIEGNIRELEGALIKIAAYSSLTGHSVDLDLAQEALKDIITPKRGKDLSIEEIQEVVAEYFGIKSSELRGRKRTRAIVFPRQIAIYLAREMTDSSLPRLGEAFGGRDHSTILHSYDKIAQEIEDDQALERTIQVLRTRLHGG